MHDCVIVGGGPAGLTAAIYLSRFLRKVAVVDSKASRAAYIPVSHNYPGFPEGIEGKAFLSRLLNQATEYGASYYEDNITALECERDFFKSLGKNICLKSRTVIIATGVIDRKPDIPHLKDFVYDGVIRFCPVCDGYETLDKRVGIFGPAELAYKKAKFLRTYTKHIEIFCMDKCLKNFQPRAFPVSEIRNLKLEDHAAVLTRADGSRAIVDFLYLAMGAKPRTGILSSLNIKQNEGGFIHTDCHQETSLKNLYAIGDITLDLSQISVAVGQAAIAAAAIHNSLPVLPRM